jgi:SAM-dependent methyltransferase
MFANSESWNSFYKENKRGGPWDPPSFLPDQHVVDFVQHFNFEKNTKILDLGCADGKNSRFLLTKGFQVYGVDISEEVVSRTQKKLPKGKFSVQDISNLSFSSAYFDSAIDAGALHVNDPKGYRKIIENYALILKPRGKLFIRCFNNTEPKKIFDVSKQYDMPVYGFPLDYFREIFKDLFKEIKMIHDPNYGAHGLGCNYFYLENAALV